MKWSQNLSKAEHSKQLLRNFELKKKNTKHNTHFWGGEHLINKIIKSENNVDLTFFFVFNMNNNTMKHEQ